MTSSKRADLNPPLGARPGPCGVVERALKAPLAPQKKKDLILRLQAGRPVDNSEMRDVYPPMVERGARPFNSVLLTSHVQFRMDLRGVTVKDFQESMARFVAQVFVWQRDPNRYRKELELLRRPEFEWRDPQSKLFIKLDLKGERLDVITTYWEDGRPEPKAPPGGCPTGPTASYRAPAGDLAGAKTFTTERSQKGLPASPDSRSRLPGESPRSDRDRAAPQGPSTPENLEQHPPGGGSYTAPPSGAGGSSKTVTPVRSPGTPGEEYGHPYKTNPAQRRTFAQDNSFLTRYPNKGDGLGAPGPLNPVNQHPHYDDQPPGEILDRGQVDRNPGSARVVPRGQGFVGHEASARRVAARLEDILAGLDADIGGKGARLNPRLMGVKAGRYRFAVPGSGGRTYTVTLHAGGEAPTLKARDLRVACECDFWRWQGPEHWARTGQYLDGAPRGTAARPAERDPKGAHRVCKHVAAVLRRLDRWSGPEER